MFAFKLPDRYQYLNETLQGGQGDVYVCMDKFLRRKVAIKVMANRSDNAEIRKEIASIQGIRSRHIAQVYDIVESTKGTLGLVEEFVPGDDVGGHAAKHKTSFECTAALYQIACGLSDIHASGKIHRDIKPRNMKLDGENVVKILDFGLSSNSARDLETVDARGTPCYIAPELYGEPPIRYTSAVDTFAYGVTARVIAEGGALLPVFRQTPPYLTPFPSFSTCPINLPPDVVGILDRTLSVDPTTRPLMSEVRDLLGRRLLFGRHRATISSGASHQLKDVGKSVSLKIGSESVTINYNGLSFSIADLAGAIFINNIPASVGDTLPDSCVITFAASRTYVPFNVSHPEVVL